MPEGPVAFGDLSASALASWGALLAREGQYSSPFLAPEFSRAVNHVSGNVFVASLGRGGDLAFFPFQRRGYMPSIGDKVGGRLSDICGFIGGPQGGFGESEILAATRLSVFCFDHWLQPGCPISGGRIAETTGTMVNFTDAETYFSNLRAVD